MGGKSSEPFWEKSYRAKGRIDTFFGGKPSPDVELAISMMEPGMSALDMGCGEGRNAFYLAQQGLITEAFDISEAGIEKLRTVAGELDLLIDSYVCDMRQFEFSKKYDLIVNHGALYYILRDEWMDLIDRMKEATVPGGCNVVNVFTDEIPEPEDQKGMMVGLFKKGELIQLYKDWEVIELRPYEIEHTHPNGPTHKHSGESLVAKKK